MSRLGARLAQRMSENGPITFAQYIRAVLYDPDVGYYIAGVVRAGWKGAF